MAALAPCLAPLDEGVKRCSARSVLLLPGSRGGGLGRKDYRQGTEESALMAGGKVFCNGTDRRNMEVPIASVGAHHSPTFSLTPKRRASAS